MENNWMDEMDQQDLKQLRAEISLCEMTNNTDYLNQLKAELRAMGVA